MAGARRKPQRNGKFQAWYINRNGRQTFFVGTTKRPETLRMAQRLEDKERQIRLRTAPAPTSAEKHRTRPFSEVAAEYCKWGECKGGRGGRPWGERHARMRRTHLDWWGKRLGLDTLADLADNITSEVDKALQELATEPKPRRKPAKYCGNVCRAKASKLRKAGTELPRTPGACPVCAKSLINRGPRQETTRAGKTLRNYSESLFAFCRWAKSRGFIDSNPLAGFQGYDTTPRSRRRRMTGEEIRRLLEAAPAPRRLLYQTALASGLRVKELRSLTVGHLDTTRACLYLSANWTKNRKAGTQPVPRWLVEALVEVSEGKASTAPLLEVPANATDAFNKDLKTAGIPKTLPTGKLDFHGLRVAFISEIIDQGASVKEAQRLARHSSPELTFNVYAKTRLGRLSDVAERAGAGLRIDQDHAVSMHLQAAGAEGTDVTRIPDRQLQPIGSGARGGIRTPTGFPTGS